MTASTRYVAPSTEYYAGYHAAERGELRKGSADFLRGYDAFWARG